MIELNHTSVEDVLAMARRLSQLEKLLLIERIAPDLERALADATPPAEGTKRRSLRGLLKGWNISERDIDEARREAWEKFPREDL